MSKPFSVGEFETHLVATMEESASVPETDTPFRIALLGDWSGRANRGLPAITSVTDQWRPLLVDRDNLDEVMAKLGVEINLPIAGPERPHIKLRFSELDDFHPDRIYERVDLFEMLRETRKRLGNPATFTEAATEVRGWTRPATASDTHAQSQDRSAATPDVPTPTGDNLLDQMFEKAKGQSTAQEVGPSLDQSDWNALLQDLIKPYLVPGDDPQKAELMASVDEAISSLMRSILHHPDFQILEAAWRALYFLVSNLETGTNLKLYLLDISHAELVADLNSSEDLSSASIYRLLVEQTVGTPGGEPWAIVAGNYIFDLTRDDIEALGRIARIVRLADAPFVAAASPHVLGCDSSLAETPDPDDWSNPDHREEGQAWGALRHLPEAAYLGLALPRFLLRLPYGENTEPTEQFEFEELDQESNHESYLWGNPAFACVYLLARTFSQEGWNLTPGTFLEIEGLPLHIYDEQGESQIKPCAEVLLTERTIESILDRGVMPLLSLKGRDAIRLARFQSLASPAAPLNGRWS